MVKSKYITLMGLIPSLIGAGITFDRFSNAYADSTNVNIANTSEQSAYEKWMESNLPGYLGELKEVRKINEKILDSVNVVDAKARAARIQIPVVYNDKTYFPDGRSMEGRHPILIKRSIYSADTTVLPNVKGRLTRSNELELELKLSEVPSLPLESDRDTDGLGKFISGMKQYPILRRLLE